MTPHFAPRISLRSVVLTAVALVAFWPTALWSADDAGDAHEPKPISDAERAAVEAVLAFFETGPNAILTRLAADSPLRALETALALDEIAVRLGPAEGSRWQLQTPGRSFEDQDDVAVFTVEFASGLDDVVVMTMRRDDDDVWRVHQLRCGVDPRTPKRSAEEELRDLFRKDEGGDTAALLGVVPGALLGAWLAILTGLALVGRRRAVAVLLVWTSAASVALVGGGCHLLPSDEEAVVESAEDEPDALTLGSLLPLRRALTGGRTSGRAADVSRHDEIGAQVLELVGTLDPANHLSIAARAWQAQMLLLDGNVGAAEKILDAAPTPDRLPLMALLRARLAEALGKDDVVGLYERARKLGPDHDGLAQEAALAVGPIDEDRMEEHVRSQVWMKARSAEGIYLAAKFDAYKDEIEDAEVLFQAAWKREPIGRFDLLRDPLLAHVAIRQTVFPLLDFSRSDEPQVGPTSAGARALELPARAEARVLGEHLVIELGDRTLSIFGAGDLVPDGAVVESAAERAEREAGTAIARFDELAAELADGGLLRPSQRRAVDALADSLIYREEWDQLIRFTEPLAKDPSAAPPQLVQARALALMRTDQTVPATNLIIGLAESDLANRRRDAGTFYQLGEMLVELGQYDLALRAMQRASGLSRSDFTSQRRAQIELMKDLEASKRVYESPNFRMVYPAGAGERYPRQLSWVLEAERERIQKWIPVPRNAPKVEVHLYPWRKFMAAHARSGGLVGGIYDGAVRVPLADFESFHPELLRTYSHEIAHALIDIATRDNAPNWFHEGLAGHIEMHQREVNPMPDMHAAGRDLTFTLLEPILSGWSEPQLVELAYINAAWTLHYIEAKKGVAGIHRMLDAFRAGHDTEGAIRKVFGVSVDRFDESFRGWAIRDAPQIWPSEMVAYHEKFDELVRRDAMDPLQRDESDRGTLRSDQNPQARFEARKRTMQRWHSSYALAARPVKTSLAKVLPLLQGQTQGDVQSACSELRTDLDLLLQDRRKLEAPDPQVALYLRRAYGTFRDMTGRCRESQWRDVRQDMERAVQYLGQARDAMRPYGVEP